MMKPDNYLPEWKVFYDNPRRDNMVVFLLVMALFIFVMVILSAVGL